MNQPTYEEFDELRKRVERIEQQQTEPIKITRLEIDSGSIHDLLVQANIQLERVIQTQADRSERLDTLERNQQELRQELYTHSETWLDALQQNFEENRADIANIKATQSDHGELLKTHSEILKGHSEMLTALKTTQDEQGQKLDGMQEQLTQILALLTPPKA
jgi:hypothetical protein